MGMEAKKQIYDPSLEARVLVISEKGVQAGDLFSRFPVFNVESASTLRGRDLEDYEAVIISGEIPSDKKLIENVQVPVIHFNDDIIDAEDIQNSIWQNNLFSVTRYDRLDSVISEAFGARSVIRQYLERADEGLERLQKLDAPKFRKAWQLSLQFQRRKPWRFSKTGFVLGLKKVYEYMVLHHFLSDPKKQKSIAKDLNGMVEELHIASDSFRLYDFVKHLGNGSTGETPVSTLTSGVHNINPTPHFIAHMEPDHEKEIKAHCAKKWVYRFIQRSKGISAKVLAEQRYRDSEFYGQDGSGFNSRKILKPLHITASGKPKSFLLMEYVVGDPVYKVIETLTRAHDVSGEEDSPYDMLRHAIVDVCLDNLVEWVNNPAPLQTAIKKKPKLKDIRRSYEKILKPLPTNLEQVTGIRFSDVEKEVWEDGVKIYRRINIDQEDLVRHRDAALGNGILGPKQNMNANDLVKLFMPRDAQVDKVKINEMLTNIDNQSGFKHCLEDLAHILTTYEARFLLSDDDTQKLIPASVRQFLYGKRDQYVTSIKRPGLKKDNESFVEMLMFRASRKFDLNLGYWMRACQDHDHSQIGINELMNRKEYISNNLAHYVIFSERLSSEVGSMLVTNLTEHVKSKFGEQLAQVKRWGTRPMSESLAIQYRDIFRGRIKETIPKDIARAYVLKSMFRKINSARKDEPFPLYAPNAITPSEGYRIR